jgi:hypothetical protein
MARVKINGVTKMPIVLKRDTKEFTLHPEGGPYPAVISEIRKHESVETAFGTKDRLQLVFQTSELARDHEGGIDDDRPMTVSVFLNATLSDKGRLMTFISQQVPSAQLNELLAKGDVDVEVLLLGTQWMLSIEHNENNGKVYANVTGAMKAPETQQIAVWQDVGF